MGLKVDSVTVWIDDRRSLWLELDEAKILYRELKLLFGDGNGQEETKTDARPEGED